MGGDGLGLRVEGRRADACAECIVQPGGRGRDIGLGGEMGEGGVVFLGGDDTEGLGENEG